MAIFPGEIHGAEQYNRRIWNAIEVLDAGNRD